VTAPARSLSSGPGAALRGLGKLYRYRDLLWQMIWADLRGRYAGSILGIFWNVLHPLVMIGIYSLVFSRIIGARLEGHAGTPYAFGIFLCAALLPWNAFAEIVGRSAGILPEHANLVKKLAFPNVLLHLYVTGTAAVHAATVMGLFLVVLAASGNLPPAGAVALWLLLGALQLMLALGLGLVASTLNVFFRDVGQLTVMLLQIWFWLTPIVYVLEIIPPPARSLLRYNFMAHFAISQQRLILAGIIPDAGTLAALSGGTLAALLAGLAVYGVLRHRIPDEL
jgi:lipopolysaccharide transport system permease protein